MKSTFVVLYYLGNWSKQLQKRDIYYEKNSIFIFFNRKKTAFDSSHIRILKSKEFAFSSIGIGGIFFTFSPSLHFTLIKLSKEATEKH